MYTICTLAGHCPFKPVSIYFTILPASKQT